MGNIVVYSQSKSKSIAKTNTNDGRYIPYQIGDGKYMKTGLGKNSHGYAVIKAFQVPSDSIRIQEHEKYLNFVKSKLDPERQPNLAPFTRAYYDEKNRTAYLIRPYFYSSLDSRLNSRPFPTEMEKLWIAYQCLQALSQLHEAHLTHGDIKPENFTISSWGWLYLTDFGYYKPARLNADDNIFSYFNYFFGSQKRHSCYLAPERIIQSSMNDQKKDSVSYPPEYNDNTLPPDQAYFVDWESDIFSLGCVFAEIFNEGQELFDLSSLLHYRNNDGSLPAELLNRIKNENVKELIMSMISKSERDRKTARYYLNEFTGDKKVFPALFSSFLYPLFRDCIKQEQYMNDRRILLVLHQYRRIMREMLGVCNISKEEQYNYLADVLEGILSKPAMESPSTQVIDQTPEIHDPSEYKNRLQELQEGILALQRKIESNEEVGKSDDQCMKTPTPFDDHFSPVEEKEERCEPCEGGNECIVLLLQLLTASMRNVHYAESKMLAILLLTDFTKYLSDNVILQRVLPHIVSVLQEGNDRIMKGLPEEYSCVLSLAIRSITTILSNISSLPHSDFNIVTDYIIPTLLSIQQNDDYQVQLTVAECLADIALNGKRLLNVAQKEKIHEAFLRNQNIPENEISVESNYREDMKKLCDGVKTLFEFAMLDERPSIACVIIQHFDDFYTFFGYKKFFTDIVGVFHGKINSPSLYVRFLAIDLCILLYRRSSKGLQEFTKAIISSVYNRHHLVTLKVLSVFVSLLEDKDNLLPKEIAEDIIIAIRPLLLHPNRVIRERVIDCIFLMERIYPKPTTQAMMIRLIQDFYDCPVFYLPWTKEALTVHLYPPLTEEQLEEAENAEYIEKKEEENERKKSRGMDYLEKKKDLDNHLKSDSLHLDFDMGTDLVKPDVFTKQMYMRVFIRQVLELDKKFSDSVSRRPRLGTGYEDMSYKKSHGSSFYNELPIMKEERRIGAITPVSKKPIKNVTNFRPTGDLIKCFTAYADASVNCIVKASNGSNLYWGNEMGMIGCYDTNRTKEADYNGFVITQTSSSVTNMHLCNNGNQLIYSTQDGLLSVLHIETRQDDSFSQSLEFAKAVPSVISDVGSTSSPLHSCFFYSSLNTISVYDFRTHSPIHEITLNSSLGAISSLVYDGKSDVLVAGTTKGYIPVYNMRYPLLVNCWQQSDHSAITHMVLGQDFSEYPTVWTTSGNNRALLWNIQSGVREGSVSVKNDLQEKDDVTLRSVAIRGVGEILGTSLVEKNYKVYQHSIECMLLPPSLYTSDYSAAYMLTAGGDRCVRYWSFDKVRSSYTVCGIEKSGLTDVYSYNGEDYVCTQEERSISTIQHASEVKHSHTKPITDMLIAGKEKDEMLVTSCADGYIRLWK